MTKPPEYPSIFHITHIDNLDSILADGYLYSDSEMVNRGGPSTMIGMRAIKKRRLGLHVYCHPGDTVGDYVPFYFCPRSVMLYVIHCGNEELDYNEGQRQIIHLIADFYQVIEEANRAGYRWAFSGSNAGAYYTSFYDNVGSLNAIDWNAVSAKYWSDPEIKEKKQAEFLLHRSFPINLVQGVGVFDAKIKKMTEEVLSKYSMSRPVTVKKDWYY